MIVISCILRPHIVTDDRECWCRPVPVECQCGNDCPTVLHHRFLEVRPDTQPRMSCYSEQIPL